MTVAALYVDPNGVYANLPGVEVWDEARDARSYAGPWPVVAHPPCQRWCRLAKQVEQLHGYRVGDDGGSFVAALEAVREFGGVLEHPAHSLAWDAYGLPEPLVVAGWTAGTCGGWSAYVEQGRYGHKMRKATWLYACRVQLPDLLWGRTNDQDMLGDFKWGSRLYKPTHDRDRPRLQAREHSATPPAFRDVLLEMARSVALEDARIHTATCR